MWKTATLLDYFLESAGLVKAIDSPRSKLGGL
jgi:hypothetical protein